MQSILRIRLLLLLLVLSVAPLPAQEVRVKDKVYLNNGSWVEGRIVHFVQGSHVEVEMPDGRRRTIDEAQVARIDYEWEKEAGQVDTSLQSLAMRSPSFQAPSIGWYHTAGLGFTPGRERAMDIPNTSPVSRNIVGFNLHYLAGYRWSRWLNLAGGLSLDVYNPDRGELVLSAVGEYRMQLLNRWSTPYLSLTAGYGRPFRNKKQGYSDTEGGLLLHPAVGLEVGGNSVRMLLDLGYRLQSAIYESNNVFEGERRRDIDYRRLFIRFGLHF